MTIKGVEQPLWISLWASQGKGEKQTWSIDVWSHCSRKNRNLSCVILSFPLCSYPGKKDWLGKGPNSSECVLVQSDRIPGSWQVCIPAGLPWKEPHRECVAFSSSLSFFNEEGNHFTLHRYKLLQRSVLQKRSVAEIFLFAILEPAGRHISPTKLSKYKICRFENKQSLWW